jgi:peroxiredoxin, Ohr subfamily
MSNPIYTAVATSVGEGREGQVATSDGTLDLQLAMPGTKQPGTNPEQLFAAGWSACFHSAVKMIAKKNKLPITDSAVVAEVTLSTDPETGFGLSGIIRLEAAGISQEQIEALAAEADKTCPYSKAVAGNIDVVVEATAA